MSTPQGLPPSPTPNQAQQLQQRAQETSSSRRKRSLRLSSVELPSPDSASSATSSVYAIDYASLLLDTRRVERPFPSMSALATTERLQPMAITRKEVDACPLLQTFLESIGQGEADAGGERNGVAATGTGPQENSFLRDGHPFDLVRPTVQAIDDSSRSSLTHGQHSRYLQLTSELERSAQKGFRFGSPKAREFKRLKEAVKSEREAFGVAMDDFRQKNISRFLMGFNGPELASKFIEAGSWLLSRYRRQLDNSPTPTPLHYNAKYIQTISLHDVSLAACNGGIEDGDIFDLGSFAAKIVYSTNTDDVKRMNTSCLEMDATHGELLRPARKGRPEATILLHEDQTMVELATKYDAHVMTTSDTFSELLRRPGEDLTRWMVPLSSIAVTRRSKIVVAQNPIPRRATTREWLTRGYSESLFEYVCTKDAQNRVGKVQYVYSLLNLPFSGSSNQACRVLVRSVNSLLDDSGRPVHLHLNLEYFHERGLEEEYSHHERCKWIMHKLLQPESRVLATRVDPKTAQIVAVEEKSVAHALAGPSGQQTVAFHGLAHFSTASRLLRAASRLGNGHHILCLPGRCQASLSASLPHAISTVTVHKAAEKGEAAIDDDCIGIDIEIKEANAAFTSTSALLACYQPWEQKDDNLQISFTFPLRDSIAHSASDKPTR